MFSHYLFCQQNAQHRNHLPPKHSLSFLIKIIFTWLIIVSNWTTIEAQEITMQITGTVIDAKTNLPLADASVYLDHTKKATISSADGQFVLKNIPSGNYTLIISFVGYSPVAIPIIEGSVKKYKVVLSEDEKMLKEVTIKANPNWQEYFSLFKMFFIGKDEQQCKITNPKVLYFDYDQTSYILTAEATKPLIIDNYALGYRVYYDLTDFVHYAGRTSYSGHTRFEEMTPTSKKDEKKWKTNREKAYKGSSNHFMFALINKKLKEEGFVVKKLVKTDTPSSKASINKQWEGEEFKSPDTLVIMRWNGLDYTPSDTTILAENDQRSRLNARYNVLYPGDVSYGDVMISNPSTGSYKINFQNSLFVTYKNKKIQEDYWGYGSAYKPSFITSILTLLVPETSIDLHGNLSDPQAILYEGYWAKLRVADQLPFDFSSNETEP